MAGGTFVSRVSEHHRRGCVSGLIERCKIEEDDGLKLIEKPPEGGSVESDQYRDPGVNAWATQKVKPWHQSTVVSGILTRQDFKTR